MNTTTTQVPLILRTICITTIAALLIAVRFLYENRRDILDTFAAGVLVIADGVVDAINWCRAHKQQARDAALLTLLATLAAADWCYRAGRSTRRIVDAVSRRSCSLLPHQPVPAVAPITATIAAAREALAYLVARLYPEPVVA